ncbi:hypothetical protein D3C78_1951410 [compost metagenome]
MLAGAAGTEVVDHGAQIGERAGSIDPHAGPLGLLHAGSEHLHRGFIGVLDVLLQQPLAQRID